MTPNPPHNQILGLSGADICNSSLNAELQHTQDLYPAISSSSKLLHLSSIGSNSIWSHKESSTITLLSPSQIQTPSSKM
eukprot:c24893_g5_i1 orf=6-242(-)